MVGINACPKCETEAPEGVAGRIRCQNCGRTYWGAAYDRPEWRIERAQQATLDDAACAHHPTKKAVAICRGTGSYICALCRVNLDGESYSVQYLNAGGKKLISESTRTALQRPDRMMLTLSVLSVIPFYFLSPIMAPFILVYGYRMFALRRKSETYRLAMPMSELIAKLGCASIALLIAVSMTGLFLWLVLFAPDASS